MIHDLKTWPDPFRALVAGEKTFEVRWNDRDYQVGDTLHLREFDPATGLYSGEVTDRRVTYILSGGQFGIEDGFVVMGVKSLRDVNAEKIHILVCENGGRELDFKGIISDFIERHTLTEKKLTLIDFQAMPMPDIKELLMAKPEHSESNREPWRKGRPLR